MCFFHRETMASSFQCFWGLFFSLSIYFIQATPTSNVYIVYLGLNQSHDPLLTSKHHHQLLSNVFECEEAVKQSILYHYKHSFSGFAAKLNENQANILAKMEGVVSVFRSRTMKLHTTRSWDFMGLTLDESSEVTPLQLAYGDDIVVGVLDSGVWPESKSFQEESCLGPIPSCWKGKCVKGEMFDPKRDCNRKLIGAQYYHKGFEEEFGPVNPRTFDYKSPRDFVGHGTHTASTAVGSVVKNVSSFGFGQGTARGGAPRTRLAVYKVCWNEGLEGICSEADIMAGFDNALHDGVHVISASFGGGPPLRPFFKSQAGIGSFHAMQLGVSVVFSAGNDGPAPSSVGNVAPWSICVAASTIDRSFPTKILLDKTISVMGEGFVTKKVKGKLAPARTFFRDGNCSPENSRNKTAEGMVILCFSNTPSDIGYAEVAVVNIGASGLIYALPVTDQIAETDIIPTVRINQNQGTKLRQYIDSAPKPVVISPSKTTIGKSPAPTIAHFSSRGPNTVSSDILKPDISAPGASIMAAWPPVTPPAPSSSDKRSVNWNFLSGTSMACPHVTGVVALIKSAHPDWSPAAIKSAIMTTAYNRDSTHDSILAGGSRKVADPFDIGAGHLNPLKAMDPGLVYDMQASDYIAYLCDIGYTREQIKAIVLPGTHVSCSKEDQSISNLNYPSITVSNLQSTVTIKRTVRNVGPKKTAVYFVSIVNPCGVKVSIWPRILFFSCFKEEHTYYVTLKPQKKSQGRYDFGEIVWTDGFHYVRSPLVVSVNNAGDSDDSLSYSI
ncbi:Subtilisin-like protease SBT3.18 [Vitis vinifera]|uniref:Subtilisin-like protease SBT3.18 n=2 Tax=Vitis vinifera TaxID=29760 RepID=A0A438EM02_VITVI|nr:Subtilisin-like protease SBT3.18 [Vitis vinifera]